MRIFPFSLGEIYLVKFVRNSFVSLDMLLVQSEMLFSRGSKVTEK